MSIKTLYNEIDPYCCAWLSNLMDAGLIRPGVICDKSIVDISPDYANGFELAHYFAGIAGWDYALTLAGWRFDGRRTWTGSCPCQPFSAAGKGKAADDERHLWPAWFSLIRECRPAIVFGEQVEAAIGWGWLDAVFADLEAEGYACGAAVLPACGIGAPHIRQRVWFVADATVTGCKTWSGNRIRTDRKDGGLSTSSVCSLGELADAASHRTGDGKSEQVRRPAEFAETYGATGELGHASSTGLAGWSREPTNDGAQCEAVERTGDGVSPLDDSPSKQMGRARQPWQDCAWLPCTDGKARPVESGTFPLAHGIPGRVGRLRAYGNAIVPQVAASFIAAMQRTAAA